jgi:hypothetical protein
MEAVPEQELASFMFFGLRKKQSIQIHIQSDPYPWLKILSILVTIFVHPSVVNTCKYIRVYVNLPVYKF